MLSLSIHASLISFLQGMHLPEIVKFFQEDISLYYFAKWLFFLKFADFPVITHYAMLGRNLICYGLLRFLTIS